LVDRVKAVIGSDIPLMGAALSFCTAFDAVRSVIPGAVSKEQLLGNIESMKYALNLTTRAELEIF